MVYRCTESFETREDGYPVEIEADTAWMRVRDAVADGGYELVVLRQVDFRGPTGLVATVRIGRLSTSFERVTDEEIWWPEPFKEES